MNRQFPFEVGQDSHRGKVREDNQDAFGWFSLARAELLVVADGMGGGTGGKVAADTAVGVIHSHFAAAVGPVGAALHGAVAAAHATVIARAAAEPALAGMGATAVVLAVRDGLAYLAHVGDSRAYLFRQGTLTRLTRDHSRVQDLMDQGVIPASEAESHPEAHVITRCIGCASACEADIRPDPIIIQPGDLFMLCTDGLTGLIPDREIAGLLAGGRGGADQLCRDLVQAALQRGGHDNVTVQVFRALGASPAPVRVAPPRPPAVTSSPGAGAGREPAAVSSSRRPFPWALAAVGLAVLVVVLAALMFFVYCSYMPLGQPEPPPTTRDEPAPSSSRPEEAAEPVAPGPPPGKPAGEAGGEAQAAAQGAGQ